MNEQKKIVNWLQSTEIPISSISENTGISRQTLYKWMQATVPIKINRNKLNSLYTKYYNEIEQEENMSYTIEAQKKTIDLQEQRIENLEQTNKQLKQNVYSIQSKKWEELPCDFFSDVYITFLPFKRTVKEMNGHGVKELSDRLKMKKDLLLNDYFSVGKWHNFNDHPVNDIIEPKTLKELQGLSIQMPTLFESLKLLVGEHYFQQLITYKYKNNTVHTICNIKINWLSKPHRAQCKTQFISE